MNYISQELKQFSKQIKYAIDNYKPHGITEGSISNIVICGMGGSGIAGRIIKSYFHDKIGVPVEIVNDYTLPRYTGPNTLTIFCSYSGNTEETVATYQIAREKGCKIIAITGGGQLEAKAKAHEKIVYNVEGGLQPRMALGSPLTYLFLIFFDLLGQYKNADLAKIAEYASNTDDYIIQSGEIVNRFTENINNKYIIICDTFFEGVATRFAQQINENAKLEAFVNVLPEANHNAIESYYGKQNTNFIFLNSRSSSRTNLRFSFLKGLLGDAVVAEILVKDTSLNALYHNIYLLDWMSLQIANKVGAVSNQIANINSLKEFLSKQS